MGDETVRVERVVKATEKLKPRRTVGELALQYWPVLAFLFAGLAGYIQLQNTVANVENVIPYKANIAYVDSTINVHEIKQEASERAQNLRIDQLDASQQKMIQQINTIDKGVQKIMIKLEIE